jgi:putative oxidoreductase
MPAQTALFVSLVELIGGITLAAGIFTRLTALVLFINMTVAFMAAEMPAFLGVISDPDKFQGASAYNDWFAALLILILGPGLFAIDTLFRRKGAPNSRS